MRNARRTIALIAALAALSTGTVILTSHAADQAPPANVSANAPTHVGALTGATAPKPTAGAPQVPEESATIRDDPTIAPDSKQSADNSVSFPNDI
jgi:hypothetical protein